MVIIDDQPEAARPIEIAFNNLNIGNQFFQADDVLPIYPEHPLKNIKLVFLDLYYNNTYGTNFNPHACADWLEHIVPAGKDYTLVIWSNDVDKTDILLNAIREINGTLPTTVVQKSKKDYLRENLQDNIEKMLGELGIHLKDLSHN